MFSSRNPWVNPSIETLQQEFDTAYPSCRVKLHLNDAAVVPVQIFPLLSAQGFRSHNKIQTIRDIGVFRYQLGQEAIKAVNEHLASQYNKRQLDSKAARAAYIQTLISDKQYPFIWECFRPGSIPIGGAKLYYDDVSETHNINFPPASLLHHQKRRGRFQSIPILRAFSVYWTAYGIHAPVPPSDPGAGNRPIGTLAMAAAAVSAALFGNPSTSF